MQQKITLFVKMPNGEKIKLQEWDSKRQAARAMSVEFTRHLDHPTAINKRWYESFLEVEVGPKTYKPRVNNAHYVHKKQKLLTP